MRILWLSPWVRTLSRVQVDALTAAGHECRLVTTDQHYEPVVARADERVLDPRIKSLRNLGPLLQVWREARAWRPDVVVAEMMHDPRWLLLARLAPLVHVVHDDRPHDRTEIRPAHRRAVLDHLTRCAARVVAPSAHVARELSAHHGRPVDVVRLTSDAVESQLPPLPVPASDRRDMVLFGRMSPYKNVPVTLRAWAAHTRSPAYRGDRLILLGDGPLELGDTGALPEHCEWRRGRFAYADILSTLSRAKASLVHYRFATQSGVQVLSMQLGVTPIASDSGGLPEFCPPGMPPVGVDDVDGLTAAFGELADPETAARRGALVRRHYEHHLSPDRAAEAWVALFEEIVKGVPAARR